MILKKFGLLAECFQNDQVRSYYDLLLKKRFSIVLKRIFDFFVSLIMLVVASPLILIIAVLIRIDSPGNVVFKQKRITTYGKEFYIYKFRSMYQGSDKGSQVTVNNDSRITKIGHFLRKYRLDELLQLINILKGEMSFVGTRPEVEKYVNCYSEEMYATLLLPAGVTSLASIMYKDEERLLFESTDTDRTYIEEILPDKMKYNLEYIKDFSFFYDIKIMFMTFFAVIKKDEAQVNEAEEKSIERVQ